MNLKGSPTCQGTMGHPVWAKLILKELTALPASPTKHRDQATDWLRIATGWSYGGQHAEHMNPCSFDSTPPPISVRSTDPNEDPPVVLFFGGAQEKKQKQVPTVERPRWVTRSSLYCLHYLCWFCLKALKRPGSACFCASFATNLDNSPRSHLLPCCSQHRRHQRRAETGTQVHKVSGLLISTIPVYPNL